MSWLKRRRQTLEQIKAIERFYAPENSHRIVEGNEMMPTNMMPEIRSFTGAGPGPVVDKPIETSPPAHDRVLVEGVDLDMVRLHGAKDAIQGILDHGHGGGNWRRLCITKLAQIKDELRNL